MMCFSPVVETLWLWSNLRSDELSGKNDSAEERLLIAPSFWMVTNSDRIRNGTG